MVAAPEHGSADEAVLTAPLRIGAATWTSREVAASIGVSQSAVARVWRRQYFPSDRVQADLPSAIALRGVWVGGGHAVIAAGIVDATPVGTARKGTALMRSPRRCAMQALLAARLVGAHTQAPDPRITEPDGEQQLLVLSTLPQLAYLPPSARLVHVEPGAWQSLLAYLVRAIHRSAPGDLLDAQRAVVEWAMNPVAALAWTSNAAPTAASPTAIPVAPVRTAQLAVADQAFERIIERIREGALGAGDPVTESWLARSLHTTRNQTRDALRALASIGLLDYRGSRGVLVPTPTRADVFDTYAARRALGAEILRRCIANPALDLPAIDAALARVVATARTGDSYATGNADLAFQDTVATCSGMRTLPQMMATLARQLRVYIAVLGLGYVYPIEEMVADDTELARCLHARDTAAALRAWDRKIDATLRFMTAHVSRAR